jgi:hypothetical protein
VSLRTQRSLLGETISILPRRSSDQVYPTPIPKAATIIS